MQISSNCGYPPVSSSMANSKILKKDGFLRFSNQPCLVGWEASTAPFRGSGEGQTRPDLLSFNSLIHAAAERRRGGFSMASRDVTIAVRD